MTLEAMTTCPSCGSGGYHLFGERHPPEVSFIPFPIALSSRRMLGERVDRECRHCGHQWSEEIEQP